MLKWSADRTSILRPRTSLPASSAASCAAATAGTGDVGIGAGHVEDQAELQRRFDCAGRRLRQPAQERTQNAPATIFFILSSRSMVARLGAHHVGSGVVSIAGACQLLVRRRIVRAEETTMTAMLAHDARAFNTAATSGEQDPRRRRCAEIRLHRRAGAGRRGSMHMTHLPVARWGRVARAREADDRFLKPVATAMSARLGRRRTGRLVALP